MRKLRTSTYPILSRALSIGFGLLILPVCVAVMLFVCHFQPAVPVLVDTHDITQQVGAAATLSQLSNIIFTLDLSLIGVSVLLLKVQTHEATDRMDIILGGGASIFAMLAMVAGYRFLMGISEQLALDKLRIDVITDRIDIQAKLTLVSAMFLLSLLFDRFRLRARSR